MGPLYPASIAVRLTRVRGWSALPELVAGAELEPQRADGNVQPNVRPPLDFLVLSPRVHAACPYSLFCQSLWMCEMT